MREGPVASADLDVIDHPCHGLRHPRRFLPTCLHFPSYVLGFCRHPRPESAARQPAYSEMPTVSSASSRFRKTFPHTTRPFSSRQTNVAGSSATEPWRTV